MNFNRELIEAAWADRSLLNDAIVTTEIRRVIEALDRGWVRVAKPENDGSWTVNEWIKKAVLLYFPIQGMNRYEVSIFEYHDKIPLKRHYDALQVRVVPPAVARYGSYLAQNVILMP